MSENLIIFNARIVTPTGTSARKGAEVPVGVTIRALNIIRFSLIDLLLFSSY